MTKKYTELYITPGDSISDAVRRLQYCHSQGQLRCAEFNGVTLYSDTVTEDSAHMEIIGMTKDQFEKERDTKKKEWESRIAKEKEEHEANLPSLIQQYIDRAEGVIPEDKMEYWKEIVPIRLNDLYRGMELDSALTLLEMLHSGCELSELDGTLSDQNHSGMSYALTVSIVKEFSGDRRGDLDDHFKS